MKPLLERTPGSRGDPQRPRRSHWRRASTWTTAAMLVLTWLMLNTSLAPGHLLLAAAFAIAIVAVVPRSGADGDVDVDATPADVGDRAARSPAVPRPALRRRLRAVARLAWRVQVDIVVANFDVARRVLGRESALDSRFVWVPLTLRHPAAAATLAGIVTLTPGTVSSELTPDRRWLLVHVLHCTDTGALAATLRERYERPLAEIFE